MTARIVFAQAVKGQLKIIQAEQIGCTPKRAQGQSIFWATTRAGLFLQLAY